jgi:hypothetical protein
MDTDKLHEELKAAWDLLAPETKKAYGKDAAYFNGLGPEESEKVQKYNALVEIICEEKASS